MEISQPVWIGIVVSGSIHRLILGSCCCSLITVSYQSRIFNSQWFVSARFAVCDINYFGIHDILWYIVFLPIKGDSNSVMCSNIHAMPWLPDMQDQTLWMLHWHSFSECGREHVTVTFAPKDCQYLINECLQPIGNYITEVAKQNIVDAPLTLILRMAQWPCHCPICQLKPQIHRLYIAATESQCN